MVDDQEGGNASGIPPMRVIRDATTTDRDNRPENDHHEIDHTYDDKGPFVVDAWPEDGMVDWDALARAGWPWVGGIAKTSEGLAPATSKEFPRWDLDTWAALGRVAGPTFLRGRYHYGRIAQDPIQQAEFAEHRCELAGGHGPYDLPLLLDMEGANNPVAPGRIVLEDWMRKFVGRTRELTGYPPILYGNIYLAENGVTSTCGCDFAIVARYTPTLPANIYQRIGWTWSSSPAVAPPTLAGWQYAGKKNARQMDGDVSVTGYPLTTPAGLLDITALILGNGGRAGYANLLRYLKIEPGAGYV